MSEIQTFFESSFPSIIGTAIGAGVGGLAVFGANYVFEIKKAEIEKKNIRKFIKLELEEIQNILRRCNSEGEKKDDKVWIFYDSGIWKKVDEGMIFQSKFDENFYVFQPTNYPNLSGETKARVFDEYIELLELTYRKIKEFRIMISPTVSAKGDYFDEDKGKKLLEALSDSISRLDSKKKES